MELLLLPLIVFALVAGTQNTYVIIWGQAVVN